MTKAEIIEFLQSKASEKTRNNLIRMGIPEDCSIGVSTGEIRKLGREIKRSNSLSRELWETGYHEAKLLSVLILDPNLVDTAYVDWLMQGVQSWDLCDHICKNLLLKLPDYEQFILAWSNDHRTYYKRAAFCLIASTAIHSKELSSAEIDHYLNLIYSYADDHRLHVKKAICWALREIGKRDFQCQEKAIIMAHTLCHSSGKDAIWIGKNALKELEDLVSVSGRKRLIKSSSKMGRE